MIRLGAPREYGRTYTHRPGAYAILPRNGRLLLTFQGAGQNELQLPGGGIDPAESPLAALHREILEETGWRIGRPRLFKRFRRFVFMPDYGMFAEKVCHIYVAHPVRRLCAPTEPHHTALWVPAAEAVSSLGNEGDRATVGLFVGSELDK